MEGFTDDIALCRCRCGTVLKVLSLPVGGIMRCPNCQDDCPKPTGGLHAEQLSGVVSVVMARAHMLLKGAYLPPDPVCDHCHARTSAPDGFAATREVMLHSDLAALYPRGANVQRPEAAGDPEAIRVFSSIIAADPSPWLLCEDCAWVVFPSAVRSLLSVDGAAEPWDWEAIPLDARDYFPDYQEGLPGEIAQAARADCGKSAEQRHPADGAPRRS